MAQPADMEEAMVENLVLKLSDGEELVMEGLEDESVFEDPRERTIEVRRAVQAHALERESSPRREGESSSGRSES